jgi:hypothetical protein
VVPVYFWPATDDTYSATDWICVVDRTFLNAGIPPPPFVTWWTTSASEGLS